MKFHFNKSKVLEALAARSVLALFIIGVGLLLTPDGSLTTKTVEKFPLAGNRVPARTVWVVATAYSSDVAQTDDTPCIPANGYNLCEHYEEHGFGNTIAANFLPLETHVRLPELFGDQVLIVRDRMNRRYGPGRIDIWMPTRQEAKEFGVQYLKMEQFGGGQWRWRVARK
jgi:3D (Asp-Asp-Asp) domain-containing protein